MLVLQNKNINNDLGDKKKRLLELYNFVVYYYIKHNELLTTIL